MKTMVTPLKGINKNKSYKLKLKVSKDMLERFAELTGDSSSLHTNEIFARRSSYRENVVHGMLPVITANFYFSLTSVQ